MICKLIQAALAMAAAAAVAGVAYAAIPSSNGVISACANADGTIKLIDKEGGQSCAPAKTLVEWNQQGPAGSQGPAGAEGPPGPAGPAGADGVSGYVVVNDSDPIAPSGTGLVTATCPTGKQPLGGGWWANPQTPVIVFRSRPNGTAWEVFVRNEHPEVGITFNVYAICAKAS